MSRVVTEHEMDRRRAMVNAKCDIVAAMSGHDLTAMEWVNVLHEAMQSMIRYGLSDEWKDDK